MLKVLLFVTRNQKKSKKKPSGLISTWLSFGKKYPDAMTYIIDVRF